MKMPPDFWKLWPLLIGLAFITMRDPRTTGQFVLQALTVIALTFSIALRICHRRNP